MLEDDFCIGRMFYIERGELCLSQCIAPRNVNILLAAKKAYCFQESPPAKSNKGLCACGVYSREVSEFLLVYLVRNASADQNSMYMQSSSLHSAHCTRLPLVVVALRASTNDAELHYGLIHKWPASAQEFRMQIQLWKARKQSWRYQRTS